MLCEWIHPLLLVVAATNTVNASPKPHIVFVLVDDWGWANAGYHRNGTDKEVVTPNIDALAISGLQLDQHYTFRVCGPSRSSLMTGRFPIHVNDDTDAKLTAYNPEDKISGYYGIPRNMTGIAAKMKKAGYATHQVGKWDAGMATPNHTPKGRGFDTSLCYNHHGNDYFNEVDGKCGVTDIVDFWDTGKPAHELNGTGEDNYEEALFRDRVLGIINNHDIATPLFLYYAPHLVHDPYQVPDRYLAKFSFIDDYYRRIYHAMLNYLDDVVGPVVDALKSRGIWDNLLLVVSTDNGGPISSNKGGNNYPLKGGKATDWQGGVRGNAFVNGGFLPETQRGKKTEGYIHLADWYGTFCGLAGVDPTDTKAAAANLPPVDSMDMWPLISGQNSTSPRVDIPISNKTLISGDYKILVGDVHSAGWTGPIYPNTTKHAGIEAIKKCRSTGCLYNIKEDPEERKDLRESMPEKLKDMQAKLVKYQATHFSPNRGQPWPGACDVAIDKYDGFWGPFLEL